MAPSTAGPAVTDPGVAHAVDAVALLVALRCLERLAAPRQLRITLLVERPRGGWGHAERQRLVTAASAPARAVVDGRVVDEPLASRRWLAWFPRPVGPHHAVSIASPAVTWVADRHPGLDVVRAHLALPTWRAEVLQTVANVGRTDVGARWLERWVDRARSSADVPGAADARWAGVVEAVADGSAGRGHDAAMLLRGWAHGVDRAGLADLLADGRADVTTGAGAAGVLDHLAEVGAVRWSVADPVPVGT